MSDPKAVGVELSDVPDPKELSDEAARSSLSSSSSSSVVEGAVEDEEAKDNPTDTPARSRSSS